ARVLLQGGRDHRRGVAAPSQLGGQTPVALRIIDGLSAPCVYHQRMQQALTSSLYRSIAVAGLLLALTVAYARGSKPHTHHLALHAVDQPGALYLTVWRHGIVITP